jgi:predicted nucleic acid-binding protein
VITAVDTSVLLDVFGADARHGPRSKAAVRKAIDDGRLVACDAVWAEVVSAFPDGATARAALATLGVEYGPLDERAAATAGETFRTYRARGGKRTRVVADFLIAAHAFHQADRLLTRDRGFCAAYFAALVVVDPAA